MRRLPQPLVYVPLEVADHLAELRGRPLLRQAALRRAVSTAYYCVFHALCAVCADELVGWSTNVHEPVYRSLDHGIALDRLRSPEAFKIDLTLKQIGLLFKNLQEWRHKADYSPPQALLSKRQALALIEEAREAIKLIEALTEKDQRRRLAILLIAKPRRT